MIEATDVEAAKERIRACLAAKKAAHDSDEPYQLGSVYETEFGSGRVLWEIDLNDVALVVGAEPSSS